MVGMGPQNPLTIFEMGTLVVDFSEYDVDLVVELSLFDRGHMSLRSDGCVSSCSENMRIA